MSDMQVSVGFWREACLYATTVLSGSKVFFNQLFYETQ
jgi:hypothetical protein